MHAAGTPVAALTPGAVCFDLRINTAPKPKGRPRSRVAGIKQIAAGKWVGKPFVQVYTDEVTRAYEDEVARQILEQIAGQQIAGVLPLSGRILIELRFYLERPKSTPKSVQHPVKNRTDVDNLAKAVLDAAQNAGLIANDCLITDLSVSKRYADDAHPVGVEMVVTGKL